MRSNDELRTIAEAAFEAAEQASPHLPELEQAKRLECISAAVLFLTRRSYIPHTDIPPRVYYDR